MTTDIPQALFIQYLKSFNEKRVIIKAMADNLEFTFVDDVLDDVDNEEFEKSVRALSIFFYKFHTSALSYGFKDLAKEIKQILAILEKSRFEIKDIFEKIESVLQIMQDLQKEYL